MKESESDKECNLLGNCIVLVANCHGDNGRIPLY